MRLTVALALTLAALHLLPLPAAAATLPADIGAEVALGRNLADDTCRLRRVESRGFGERSERYQIFCDGWDQPSGMIVRNPGGNRAAARWLEDSGWIQTLLSGSRCEPVVAEPLVAGFETFMRRCTHREGWRRLAIAATADRQLFIGDFLPANAPLIERAIMAASGRRPLDAAPPEGTRLASRRALEELLGPNERLVAAREVGALRNLTRLANQQQEAREYRKAEMTFRRLLEVQEQMVGTNNPTVVYALHHLVEVLRHQRRYDAANAMVARAEPLVLRAGDPRDTARHATLNASEAMRMGDRHGAVRQAERAVSALAGMEKNYPGISALAHFLLARALQPTDLAGAENAARTSYRLAAQAGGSDDGYTNRAHITLARILIARRKLPEAKFVIDEAVKSSELLYGRTIWWANAKLAEADYFTAAGNDGAALAAYRDYLTVSVRNPESCFIGPCVEGYLDLLLKHGNGADGQGFLAEAFQAAQLTETPVLTAAISRLAARVQADEPGVAQIVREQQDIEEEQGRIRDDLLTEMGRKPEERDAGREAALRGQLRGLIQAGEDKALALQDRFPRYARLIGRQPVDAAQASRLMKPGEALYLLAMAGDRGYGFLLHQGRVQVHRVPLGRAALASRVEALRAGLRVEGGHVAPFDLAAAHALYRDLFGPLLEGADSAAIQRLLVVPTGALASLPLEVLVTTPAPQGDYAGAAWLMRRFAIAGLPSVRSLADLRGAPAPSRSTSFFGLGDPSFAGRGTVRAVSPEDSCAERRNARGVVAGLPALPETGGEIRELARGVGGASKLVFGAQATKASLRAPELGRADVIAFATHALLPYELFCDGEPALALSPGNAADDDGLLRASEVSALRLDATLVILSACNTAGGDGRFGGESLSGLVRAFFFAGSRNVLSTHWPVATQPTVTLTTGMMKQRGDLPGALRAAKLAMVEQPATAHPFYWGAFSLIGGG